MLLYYGSKKPAIIQCVDSSTGLGGVLLQDERPVSVYGLSKCDGNWSNYFENINLIEDLRISDERVRDILNATLAVDNMCIVYVDAVYNKWVSKESFRHEY